MNRSSSIYDNVLIIDEELEFTEGALQKLKCIQSYACLQCSSCQIMKGSYKRYNLWPRRIIIYIQSHSLLSVFFEHCFIYRLNLKKSAAYNFMSKWQWLQKFIWQIFDLRNLWQFIDLWLYETLAE